MTYLAIVLITAVLTAAAVLLGLNLSRKRRFEREVDRMIAEQIREQVTHPNCRCVLVPVTSEEPDFYDFIEPGIAGDIATIEGRKGRLLDRGKRGPGDLE